jgi:endo-1,4-beta-xylanase
MSGINRRSVIALSLCVGAILLGWRMTTPIQAIHAQGQNALPSAASNAYLELYVEPRIALKGTLVTLNIVYHHIGLPYTMISITPSEMVAFDPPLTMPCKYDQHPNGCTAITFRTLSTGAVQFHAGATGEVYDESCGCFIWGGAVDNGPANLVIVDAIWQAFLPSIQR